MENKNSFDEVVIKVIGKLTLKFDEFKDLEKQRQLKEVLEEGLYGYEITSKSTELICSDLEEKIQIYLMSRSIEGISKRTLYNYNLILCKFMNFFNTKTVSMITHMDVQYFLVNYKKEHKIKNSSLNSIIFCLKKFFSWLHESEYITKNPMLKIKEIKVEKRLKRVATDAEVELLKDSCTSVKEELLLNFSLDTGCRVGEIATLRVSNINFNNLSCTVIGKGNKERYVYFTEKTKLLINKYLNERKEFEEHEALFLSDKFPYQRIKVRALQLILTNIKKCANLQDKDYITLHGNRRWLGTHLLNKRVDLESVRQILGHTNPSTTLIYSQMTNENIHNNYKIGI